MRQNKRKEKEQRDRRRSANTAPQAVLTQAVRDTIVRSLGDQDAARELARELNDESNYVPMPRDVDEYIKLKKFQEDRAKQNSLVQVPDLKDADVSDFTGKSLNVKVGYTLRKTGWLIGWLTWIVRSIFFFLFAPAVPDMKPHEIKMTFEKKIATAQDQDVRAKATKIGSATEPHLWEVRVAIPRFITPEECIEEGLMREYLRGELLECCDAFGKKNGLLLAPEPVVENWTISVAAIHDLMTFANSNVFRSKDEIKAAFNRAAPRMSHLNINKTHGLRVEDGNIVTENIMENSVLVAGMLSEVKRSKGRKAFSQHF